MDFTFSSLCPPPRISSVSIGRSFGDDMISNTFNNKMFQIIELIATTANINCCQGRKICVRNPKQLTMLFKVHDLTSPKE